jgi:hypothetical protein
MKHHLKTYPYDTIAPSNVNRRIKIDGSGDDGNQLKSTLRVSKRNGEISVAMRPLKEGKELETDCCPYLNCTPLKFEIKKRPEEKKKHKARMILKARGIERKCRCTDIKFCRCMSRARKLLFQDELRQVSKKMELKNELKYEDLHDSSDSEVEFDFTPPTASILVPQCKPHVTHTGTQYEIKHFAKKDVKFALKK